MVGKVNFRKPFTPLEGKTVAVGGFKQDIGSRRIIDRWLAEGRVAIFFHHVTGTIRERSGAVQRVSSVIIRANRRRAGEGFIRAGAVDVFRNRQRAAVFRDQIPAIVNKRSGVAVDNALHAAIAAIIQEDSTVSATTRSNQPVLRVVAKSPTRP